MSKKTFYLYFATKDILVEKMIDHEIQDSTVKCNQTAAISKDAIEEIFHSMNFVNEDIQDLNPILMHDLKKYHRSAYDKLMDGFNQVHKEVIRKNLIRGVKDGLYRKELNIDVLTKFRLNSIFLAFDQEYFPKENYRLIDVTHVLLDNFLHGIVTPKGHDLIKKYKQQYNNILI
jgi:hypothetical protein